MGKRKITSDLYILLLMDNVREKTSSSLLSDRRSILSKRWPFGGCLYTEKLNGMWENGI